MPQGSGYLPTLRTASYHEAMADSQDCTEPTRRAMPHVAGPILIALAATVATWATLAPEGWGPGVTCDEMDHIGVGKRLVMAFRRQGAGFFLLPAILRGISA